MEKKSRLISKAKNEICNKFTLCSMWSDNN